MSLVRLLGPVDVVDEAGQVHAPHTPIRRTLLALLALEAGQTVDAERLLDQTWDGAPPDSGLRALRFHISRLRSEVPIEDLIVTVGSGYRLDADTDVSHVEATESRDATELRAALDLWRGDPLADTSTCTVLEHECQRLGELRLTVTEQLFAASVEAGDSAAIVSDLTRVCLDHPLREGLWASLIAAHYRAGHQAEALRSYDRLRLSLSETLGVDPSPELQELHRQILDQETELGHRTASAGRAQAPSGTVTFLFTDIEGSTRMWIGDSEAMSGALARHDEILRTRIADYGGVVFTTAGDSFAAAFSTASDAAEAALSIQADIATENWPELISIRVRMGLHTGTATTRDGDYFGTEVARAARIEASAHGGQIVLSPATAALVTDHLVRSLGSHQLKDFATEIELSQLGCRDFPPLRTLTMRSTNLPRTQLDLIGRSDDMVRLGELAEQTRVVTVTGAGGIGKTSLVNANGRLRAQQDDCEVWWCDLVSAEPDDVAFQVGQAIGLTNGASAPENVARAIALRPSVWLLLDNCEHVVDAVTALVSAVIELSEARVLATSRVPLGIADETVLQLAPLDVATSAVDLFVREASRVSSVGGGATDRDLVASICAHLDGIPLAIELAAARTKALSLADIDARLERLLTMPARRGGDHDRHSTMTTTIDWSIEMLDGPLRVALGALAVFEGGFDLDAAEAIFSEELDEDPIGVLAELVDHSLVETSRTRVGIRYRLLEPIRQYAALNLWIDPDATRHRHVDHYLDRLDLAYETLGESSCMPLLEMIEHEMQNLGAVHDWALTSDRLDDDLRLYRPLADGWLYGRNEPSRWALDTVRMPEIENHPGWPAAWREAMAGLAVGNETEELAALGTRYSDISPDDPAADMAIVSAAYVTGYIERDWETATALWENIDSSDVWSRFARHFWFDSLPVIAAEHLDVPVPSETVDAALTALDGGLAWTARIGARNFEAALLQMKANVMVRSGRTHDGERLAQEAERLSAALGMQINEALAGQHRVNAALLGVEIDEPLVPFVVRLIETGLRCAHPAFLCFAVRPAARLLAASGYHDTAAICALQPDAGYRDYLPRLALDDISEDTWERARAEAEKLTVLEVAKLAADTLKAVPTNPRA